MKNDRCFQINSKWLSPVRPVLTHGDSVGICAPSGVFDNERFQKGIRVLENMGFTVFIPPEVYHTKRYLAGEDWVRADVVHQLFSDPTIKGIFCARGGYGAMRVLEHLDYGLIAKNPKVFVGFSDVTALLVTISHRSKFQVYHGPVVTSLADGSPENITSLYDQITSARIALQPPSVPGNMRPNDERCCETARISMKFPHAMCLRAGHGLGTFIGGNLATLCHLIGTDFQPDFSNSILFLEEINEAPYKIDRMLFQMKKTGMLNGIQGVVVGTLKDCGDERLIYEILNEIFDFLNIPIVTGIQAGHDTENLTLPMGGVVKMDGDQKKLEWFA